MPSSPPLQPHARDWIAPPRRGVERRLWISLLLITGLLLAFVAAALYVLAGAQAYVRAEGFYVKGQLEAAHHVGRLAETGSPADYQAALDALSRPDAYDQFRALMTPPTPDAARSRHLLAHVGHTPGEARSMTVLFPAIRRLPQLAPAFDAWVEAGRLTTQLHRLTDEAARVAVGDVDATVQAAVSARAAATAREVAALGVVFSDTLAAGTQAVRAALLLTAAGLGLALVLAVGVPTVRALRKLRAADGRYRSIVRSGSDIVTVLAPSGTILYESPSVQAALGFTPDERVGGLASAYVHPDDQAAAALNFSAALAEPGAQAPLRLRVARTDGGWATLECVTVNHLDNPSIQAIVTASRDVGDRVRAEEEHAARVEAEAARRAAETVATEAHVARVRAEAARAEAEELLRLKASFLANMSHELRTPLTAILGASELLAEETPPENRDLALSILRGGLRLRDTLNSVLEHAQLEAGRVQLAAERVNVTARTAESVELLRPLADEKSLTLRAPSGPAVFATLDGQALDRIVVNLVGNAIKFTDAGSVVVSVRESMGPAGPEAEIEVADTGVGMSEAETGRVFNAFEQASEGLARRHEGNGLGLAITERLVALMNGRIALASAPGEGTVFRLHFPARQRSTRAPSGSETAPQAL